MAVQAEYLGVHIYSGGLPLYWRLAFLPGILSEQLTPKVANNMHDAPRNVEILMPGIGINEWREKCTNNLYVDSLWIRAEA